MTGTLPQHVFTRGCPLTCLEYRLPALTYNALRRHLRWWDGGHPTVGHVADLLQEGRLGDIRGLGVGGITFIRDFLESAAVGGEIGTVRETRGS